MELINVEDIKYRSALGEDGNIIFYATNKDIQSVPRIKLNNSGKWTISKLTPTGCNWSCSSCKVELLVPSGQTPMDYGNKFCLNCGAAMSL